MGLLINQADLSAERSASPMRPRTDLFDLPPTAQLLTSGGDTRIVRNPVTGLNQYGRPSTPEPAVLAFGSSTASTISSEGFAAAERLRRKLLRAARSENPSVTYARELARIRGELLSLCDLAKVSGIDVIFAASGTDIHLIAAQLVGDINGPAPLAVMIEGTETGSGVPTALAGRHFSACTALGNEVAAGTRITGAGAAETVEIAARAANGLPQPAAMIDAEVQALVASVATTGRRVLLNLIDVSKTGMIVPSLSCALELRRRFPAAVEVLVDACQFRLAPSTLRAYLQENFWIALTGSKFIGGPAFSGALLIPDAAARRLRSRRLPQGLGAYSARADWPPNWSARSALADENNYGLLLRWEAALTELQTFQALPEAAIASFLHEFAEAVRQRLARDPTFQPLPVPAPDRRPLVNVQSWDQTPTIFPFILRHPFGSERRGGALSRKETARVYEQLGKGDIEIPKTLSSARTRVVAAQSCHLGQPVLCGQSDGVPVSALRLCASMRLAVDAISPGGRGSEAVIAEALTALDKTALLTKTVGQCAAPQAAATA
jgi:hypothetical protein